MTGVDPVRLGDRLRRGRVLNEKGPTGNHASGFFFFPIGRQDGQ